MERRESLMRRSTHLLLAALACFGLHQHAVAADPGPSIIPQLQARFVDAVSKSIPNADYIMREVRLRGIVTRPLDDIVEYQESLASLGIGQPLASQFAPAVLEYLGAAGFELERSMLARVLD